jgi:allophanate hydrolase
VQTSEDYRMVALNTSPPKPGIVRVDSDGASLIGERWTISPAGLGRFLAQLPAPMSLGSIVLDDGEQAVGFYCDPVTAAAATDITKYGGWRAYLRYLSTCRRQSVD